MSGVVDPAEAAGVGAPAATPRKLIARLERLVAERARILDAMTDFNAGASIGFQIEGRVFWPTEATWRNETGVAAGLKALIQAALCAELRANSAAIEVEVATTLHDALALVEEAVPGVVCASLS